MKKVIVTGVHGFVGRSIYERLKQAGYTVIPVVRRADQELPDAIVWDITKPYGGPDVQADHVIHCAGLVDDWASYADAYQVNVVGTKHVLDTFSNIGRFVYVSSASVYNTNNKEYMITEDSRIGTGLLNGYSRSKYEAEQLILGHKSKAKKILLRPHVIYGAEERKIISRLLNAVKGSRFIVLGDGKNHISVTHIDNLCTAIMCALDADFDSQKEVFNIADKSDVQVGNLLSHVKSKFNITKKNLYIPRMVANCIGLVLEILYKSFRVKRPPLVTRYVVYQMTSNHVLSIEKAINMLKYKPLKSFVDL